MLHILVAILSAAGMVLLILLAAAAALILALLFLPVVYRGHVRKQGGLLEAGARISWMFRLVFVKVQYREKKTAFEIYLLGIPILRLRRRFQERRKQKAAGRKRETASSPASHRKPSVPPGKPPLAASSAAGIPEAGEEKKKTAAPGKIWFTIRSFCAKIKEWYRFVRAKTFQEAFRVIRERGMRILRHVLPKRVQGYVRFGLSDPASTGQLLGAAGLFLPLIPENLQLIPDFENPCLEADVKAGGRILIFVLLKNGLAVYRNPSVQKVIKKFQRKEA